MLLGWAALKDGTVRWHNRRLLVIDPAAAKLVFVAHVVVDRNQRVVVVGVNGVVKRDVPIGILLTGAAQVTANRSWSLARRRRNVFLELRKVVVADARHAAQHASSRRRSAREAESPERPPADRIVFQVAEVEQLVLDDRSADGHTQAVVVVAGNRGQPLRPNQGVHGVQLAVVHVLINRPVHFVGAGLENGRENAARSAAEFRRELILQKRKLGNRFVGNVINGAGL